MTTGKIPQGNHAFQLRMQTEHALELDQQTAAQIAAAHPHGKHKGASFKHGPQSSPMRRGPTLRMPLKSAGKRTAAKKSRKSTHPDSEFEIEEHHDEPYMQYGYTAEYRDTNVRLRSLEDNGDDQSDEGKKQEKGVDHRFKMSAVVGQGNVFSKESYALGKTVEKSPELKLPPLHSMADVVKFLHTCTQTDSSGKSLSMVLQRIAAGVLSNQIKLPVINKVADARNVLIEIFGVGYTGTASLPPALRSFHQIFPLWLVNLSRTRTSRQQSIAAARVEVQAKALEAR